MQIQLMPHSAPSCSLLPRGGHSPKLVWIISLQILTTYKCLVMQCNLSFPEFWQIISEILVRWRILFHEHPVSQLDSKLLEDVQHAPYPPPAPTHLFPIYVTCWLQGPFLFLPQGCYFLCKAPGQGRCQQEAASQAGCNIRAPAENSSWLCQCWAEWLQQS